MSMSVLGHDVQVCLSNAMKLLSEMCVTFSLNHPILSLSILSLFLLYVVFPFAFWVLVYSVPLVVCTTILLSLPFKAVGGDQPKDEAEVENDGKHVTRQTAPSAAPQDSTDVGKKKKPIARVHSVRRRRAKEFARDRENSNTQQKVEEKNAGSDTVDKNTLTTEENSPKTIREVEVVQEYSMVNSIKSSPCSASQSSKHEYDKSRYQSIKDKNNDSNSNDIIISSNNNKAAMLANEDDDHQKNKMDVVISDSERTKRLESLIARRRLRKLLGLELKRTLLNKERNQDQTSSLVPKINNMGRLVIQSSNSVVGDGPHSPIPGSAPSVMIPMRNPFDLPYDPQEEKPDLTGDSFGQEFMPANNRDLMVYCRHESFSSGSFLPGEYNRNLKEISSSAPDSRNAQRASCSLGYQSAMQARKTTSEREFAPIKEHESHESSESTPIVDSPDDSYMKKINQVRENGSEEGDIDDEVRTISAPQEEDSSSEENGPVFKIDREAILKSLSSMARRNPLQEETENTDNNNDQLGEHMSRLKERCYYTDSTTATGRHGASYSIASDLQVEVSEVSSPPLTIDENSSYLDNDDDKRSLYDADSWAGSSHLDLSQVDEHESRLAQVDEVSERFVYSRGGVPEDITVSNESHCDHPWCSIAEYPDSCRTTRATNLDDKIDKTLQRSLSLMSQSSSRDDPEECSHRLNKSEELNTLDVVKHSRFRLENNPNQIGEYATTETTPDEGHLSDESHDMEHLAAQSMTISEDSEERLPEHQEMLMESAVIEDQVELTQHSEGEQSSESSDEGTSITRAALEANNDHDEPSSLMPNVDFELVQVSPSPKSVLHPTCYETSFDHYIGDEVLPFHSHAVQVSPLAPHRDSTDFMEQSSDLPGIDGGLENESSEPSNTTTSEADDAEPTKQHEICEIGVKPEGADCGSANTSTSESNDAEFTKQRGICENGVNPIEAACGRAQVPSHDEAPAEPTEETSSTSFNMDEEASSSKENSTAFIQSTDNSSDTIPPPSAKEELSKHQEIIIGDTTEDDSKDKSSSFEVQTETSAFDEDKRHDEHNLNNPNDQEGQENLTSDCFDGTKDEFSKPAVDRSTNLDVSTGSYNTNEEDRKSQQQHSSYESTTVAHERQETNDTLTEDTK